MTEFKPIKEGKVREIYDNGDSLIMVATDRISAFDVILKNKVTKKGIMAGGTPSTLSTAGLSMRSRNCRA